MAPRRIELRTPPRQGDGLPLAYGAFLLAEDCKPTAQARSLQARASQK